MTTYAIDTHLDGIDAELMMQEADELWPELEETAAVHHIKITDVKQAGCRWFVKMFQENWPYPDGSGSSKTAIHTDLAEIYERLIQYFRYNEEVDLMNIFSTNLFEYLAGEMFLDKDGDPQIYALTIKDVKVKRIANGRGGEDEKPVVSFDGRDKLLVLNKSNARNIAVQFGGETDDWKGREIALSAEHGAWFGKKGVRVIVLDHMPADAKGRKNGNGKAKSNGAAKQPPPPADVDDVPFEQDGLFDEAPTGAYQE